MSSTTQARTNLLLPFLSILTMRVACPFQGKAHSIHLWMLLRQFCGMGYLNKHHSSTRTSFDKWMTPMRVPFPRKSQIPLRGGKGKNQVLMNVIKADKRGWVPQLKLAPLFSRRSLLHNYQPEINHQLISSVLRR